LRCAVACGIANCPPRQAGGDNGFHHLQHAQRRHAVPDPEGLLLSLARDLASDAGALDERNRLNEELEAIVGKMRRRRHASDAPANARQ